MSMPDEPPVSMSPETDASSGSALGQGGNATLFLAGDVMTGRGIDQILPHPCDPSLFEAYMGSAADYVKIAEDANGPIQRPADFSYIWGDALAELDRVKPDLRLINLETAVTAHDKPEAKGINYRMHPRNVPVLTALGTDCCILANNHVLDWGPEGLVETLETLAGAGLRTAGAGRDLAEAEAPQVMPVPGGRVIAFAFGSSTSGIPASWAATENRPGVNFLPDLSSRALDSIAEQVDAVKSEGDIVLVSLHWGGNWGYEVPHQQTDFARDLIDRAGVDLVFGHSSHHAKRIEVYNGKLILYGSGDFLNDYEGITGYEAYRDDLVLMYLPTLRLSDGALERLTMIPFRIGNFRLNRVRREGARWLTDTLSREGTAVGTRIHLEEDNTMTLEWR